jgi:glycosyltransferase involved in cell wall biosynthesis
MATYNGEIYIKEQLVSILSQLTNQDEIIISDDGSTDRTLDIINFFDDDRIKVYKNNSGRSGYTGNFINALSFAKGEIIFLSDQDDIWNHDKVSLMLEQLNKYDFVVSDATVVNQNLKVLHRSNFERMSVKKGFLNSLLRCRYLGCCYAFKREVLNAAVPFPNNHVFCPHDYWLALVSQLKFRVKVLNAPLILYRRHDNNVSSGGDTSQNSLLTKLKIRAYVISKLITLRFK